MSPPTCPHCGFTLTPHDLAYCYSCYQPIHLQACKPMSHPRRGFRAAAMACLGIVTILIGLWLLW